MAVAMNYGIEVKQFDIWFADMSPTVGSEQGGVRPVLVISNNLGNTYGPTVIVACISAQIQKAKFPTHVVLDARSHGLDRDSVVMMEQIRVIDKQRLDDKITSINNQGILNQLRKAREISFSEEFN